MADQEMSDKALQSGESIRALTFGSCSRVHDLIGTFVRALALFPKIRSPYRPILISRRSQSSFDCDAVPTFFFLPESKAGVI